MQPKNSQIKVDVMSVTKSGTDFIVPLNRASLFDGMRLALASVLSGSLTAKTSDGVSLGTLLLVAGTPSEVYVSFQGDGSIILVPINGVRGTLFDTGWHNGKRATLPVGTVGMDGQQLTAALYPDLCAGIWAGKQNVVTEAEWQANPLKRGNWSSGDLTTWVRAPDLNAVQAGTGKPFYIRGGDDSLSGTAVGDAQRVLTGTVGEIGVSGNTTNGVFETYSGAIWAANGAQNTGKLTRLNTALGGNPTADENRVRTAYGVWWVRVFGSVANPGSVDAANLAQQHEVMRGRLDNPNFPMLNGGQLAAFRNVIINGAMNVAQYGDTATITTTAAGWTADRFHSEGGTGNYILSRTSSGMAADTGLLNCLKLTATGAHTSTPTLHLAIAYAVEGYDCHRLYGKTFTLSFWARSSRVGKHSISLRSSDPASLTRSYVSEYDVKEAGKWAKYTVTVQGGIPTNDAQGTWNTTNGKGLEIIWAWNSGSSYRTATLNGWQGGNFVASANAINAIQATGDEVSITGVQLEVGSIATEFEHRHVQAELSLCLRYYETGAISEVSSGNGITYATATTSIAPKRASPTCKVFDTLGNQGVCSVDAVNGVSATINVMGALNNQLVCRVNNVVTGLNSYIHFKYTINAEL